MSSRIVYGGLCSTCTKQLVCVFPRDQSRPVMQCEEFEGITPDPAKCAEKTRSLSEDARDSSHSEEHQPGTYMGLCSNCEKRETCTFPKPESGVWRCEEYE